MPRCPHWDSGWCYHEGMCNHGGCVGGDNCDWFVKYTKERTEKERAELRKHLEAEMDKLMAEEKERGIRIVS